MRKEPLNCICKEKPQYIDYYSISDGSGFGLEVVYFLCTTCGLRGPSVGKYQDGRAVAVEEWNDNITIIQAAMKKHVSLEKL